MSADVLHGDCREKLRTLGDDSIDAIVTDPPYELGFMGKRWDSSGIAYDPDVWLECLRVLKPGGHMLVFGGTRTWHRVAVAIEDAGFEIRDSIAWMYGSGMPKSHNLRGEWQGWGTALKPAHEPIVVARKPLIGTVADNVLAHGTGALNIDGCRIATDDDLGGVGGARNMDNEVYGKGLGVGSGRSTELGGRWPANVILDESQAAELDRQSGESSSRQASMPLPKGHSFAGNTYGGDGATNGESVRGFTDTGGASRFFYCAKAGKRERPTAEGVAHPTVKPLTLIQYLIRLVTPPAGTVLDPFAGSGTTIEAAILEGFDVIGIEREADYLPLIKQRIDRAGDQLLLI